MIIYCGFTVDEEECIVGCATRAPGTCPLREDAALPTILHLSRFVFTSLYMSSLYLLCVVIVTLDLSVMFCCLESLYMFVCLFVGR